MNYLMTQRLYCCPDQIASNAGVAVGDRVAYATAPLGAYFEARNCQADKLVSLPTGMDGAQAAAALLKGMTAEYLVRRTYPVQAGETILVDSTARYPLREAARAQADLEARRTSGSTLLIP